MLYFTIVNLVIIITITTITFWKKLPYIKYQPYHPIIIITIEPNLGGPALTSHFTVPDVERLLFFKINLVVRFTIMMVMVMVRFRIMIVVVMVMVRFTIMVVMVIAEAKFTIMMVMVIVVVMVRLAIMIMMVMVLDSDRL